MPFTQECDDGQLDGRMLADQHALHIAAQPLGDGLHHGGHRDTMLGTPWVAPPTSPSGSPLGSQFKYVPPPLIRLRAVGCTHHRDDDLGMSFEARCPQCLFVTQHLGQSTPCLLHVSLPTEPQCEPPLALEPETTHRPHSHKPSAFLPRI